MAVLAACGCGPSSEAGPIPVYGYKVVHVYPHDHTAFTQGLIYLNGFLYEGTGIKGNSSIRKVRLETGEVLQKHDLPPEYFGEGIVNWQDRLVELTWETHAGFVYNLATFDLQRQFSYTGEGWGLTQDGTHLIMSDGSSELRFWNPETFEETNRIAVSAEGVPVKNLNELEYVKGQIYANVWHTDRIARIDPATGNVVAWIDLSGLLAPEEHTDPEAVLNGIAYDARGDRLFVTGKLWPKLFEIRLVKE